MSELRRFYVQKNIANQPGVAIGIYLCQVSSTVAEAPLAENSWWVSSGGSRCSFGHRGTFQNDDTSLNSNSHSHSKDNSAKRSAMGVSFWMYLVGVSSDKGVCKPRKLHHLKFTAAWAPLDWAWPTLGKSSLFDSYATRDISAGGSWEFWLYDTIFRIFGQLEGWLA